MLYDEAAPDDTQHRAADIARSLLIAERLDRREARDQTLGNGRHRGVDDAAPAGAMEEAEYA